MDKSKERMTPEQREYQRAYEEGARAARTGLDLTACPHGKAMVMPEDCVSVAHRGWLKGWWTTWYAAKSAAGKEDFWAVIMALEAAAAKSAIRGMH